MSGYSSYVTLYDANENPLAIQVGIAIPANTPAIMLAGTDGVNARNIKTASDGSIKIDPTGVTSQPITDGGGSITIDGTIAATQSGTWNATVTQITAANLNAQIVGPGASGSAVVGNPVRIAGSDGTNTRNVLTDTSGRLLVSGAAADGAAVAGNPILISGSDGTNSRVIATDSIGRLVMAPQSAASVLAGFSHGFVSLTVNTINVIRSSVYTEPASNAMRSISSSSASDSSAGTGARTVRITYYTNSYVGPNIITVTLNGTTPVNTSVSDICFIEKMEVLTVGTGGSNVGTITLFAGTAGAGGTVGTILIGANRTFWSHHYVQTGVTCYISGFQCNSTGSQGSSFHLRSKSNTSNATEIQISDNIRPNSTSNGAGTVLRTYSTPIRVVGPARVTAFVKPDQSITADYYASFDFYEQ